ncbi:MAG: class I SAM-dependent methyltransferase [Gammaproteobacteria bacterium]|nr:class I SAM-dependent methyltransferase [Gammaproteobacteria bacterium]
MWDERYSTDEYVYGTEPNAFLVDAAGTIPKGRALSLAEGEGRNAVYLAGLGYEVVAVDSSSVGLEKARLLAVDREVDIETIVADLNNYEIEPESWEGIISIFCHLPSAQRLILHKKIIKGLKPGGIFILESFTPAQLQHGTGGPKEVDRLLTLAELKESFKALDFKHAIELEREIHEGEFHKGVGAVVQLVARKPL